MKKCKILISILGFVFLFFLTACSCGISSVPSTTPLTDDTSYTVIGKTRGSSTTFAFLFFPFGSSTPLQNALQDARKQKNADALIDVKADYTVFNFLFLFGFYTTEVEGKAIKINKK